LLNFDIEDYEIDEENKIAKIVTSKENFASVKKELEKM
jgi:hypothetical protein